MLEAWRAERARRAPPFVPPPEHDLREIVNAILYVSRTGMAWRYLPHDFPPCRTVFDYYSKREEHGTTQTWHDSTAELRELALI